MIVRFCHFVELHLSDLPHAKVSLSLTTRCESFALAVRIKFSKCVLLFHAWDILFSCSVVFWDLIMMSLGIWPTYKNSSWFSRVETMKKSQSDSLEFILPWSQWIDSVCAVAEKHLLVVTSFYCQPALVIFSAPPIVLSSLYTDKLPCSWFLCRFG
ncbi:uncharacterized protein LOC110743440 isoform X2 [Papio anubis]|uniref:uncharacterized protein LOC110743440 isoform X2 n=1 Tax=Papio anubis TaxID=9555 RepID=UPI000B7B2595|nr:uncharacterized protein LOC110743440 isoform X2 [Papio anubis]XP_021794960.1 uncharacterized protein LOC110743440 isoform X2 [Papio anubis]